MSRPCSTKSGNRGAAWFEYEPFTGYRERPFRGKFCNNVPAGFRLSKDQAPWPPRADAINVFVFGGSTTYGYGLPDDETIASYLGERAAAGRSSARLAVYNFGRASYFSSQELILFQQLLSAHFVPPSGSVYRWPERIRPPRWSTPICWNISPFHGRRSAGFRPARQHSRGRGRTLAEKSSGKAICLLNTRTTRSALPYRALLTDGLPTRE